MNDLRASLLFRRLERISHKDFVLHGSPRRRALLVPRKPVLTSSNKNLLKRAVYATSVVHVGLFYAVIAGDPRWRYFLKEKEFRLLVPEEGLDACRGYLHVCHRSSFTKHPLVSYSRRPVRVAQTIRVHPHMLSYLAKRGQIKFVEKFS